MTDFVVWIFAAERLARIDDPLAPFVAASVHRGYRPTIADALDAVKLRAATDK